MKMATGESPSVCLFLVKYSPWVTEMKGRLDFKSSCRALEVRVKIIVKRQQGLWQERKEKEIE